MMHANNFRKGGCIFQIPLSNGYFHTSDQSCGLILVVVPGPMFAASAFHIPSSIFHIPHSTFHIPLSTFHGLLPRVRPIPRPPPVALPGPCFPFPCVHIPLPIFHFPHSTLHFHIPLSTFHFPFPHSISHCPLSSIHFPPSTGHHCCQSRLRSRQCRTGRSPTFRSPAM